MNIAVGLVVLIVVLIFILSSVVKILMEYQRGVIFRLGRFARTGGPGLTLLIPLITRDNVSVKVSAVVYFRVIKPEDAVINVEDFLYATSQLSQTTLRSILGQAELDELLSARDKINEELQTILDRQTENWGIKVTNVEVKHVDLPQEMQRAMARQAEAERERRAKVINAEGEFQAATRLAEAAQIIAVHPQALQLRFLQTLSEVATENNSTILFPLPIDLLTPFLRSNQPAVGSGGNGEPQG
jgi:regulator of protease activity HflC (stomatin/prohibitin superfamily)